jgi:large subunit ribosomal protein L21
VYAIIQANGRQVKVAPGAVVEIDGVARIDGNRLEKGAKVTFDRVLLVEKDAGDIVAGAPFVADARVLAEIEGESRGPKLRVFKKKRRKGFRKTRGHRSVFTRVRITEIQA